MLKYFHMKIKRGFILLLCILIAVPLIAIEKPSPSDPAYEDELWLYQQKVRTNFIYAMVVFGIVGIVTLLAFVVIV